MLNSIQKRSLRSRNGRLLGRPPGEGAQHLLAGLATCASCNASMETRSRRQVSDQIWLVSFMDYDLGYFDRDTCRLEPINNPFSSRVLPMSSKQSVTHVSGTDQEAMASPTGFEPYGSALLLRLRSLGGTTWKNARCVWRSQIICCNCRFHRLGPRTKMASRVQYA